MEKAFNALLIMAIIGLIVIIINSVQLYRQPNPFSNQPTTIQHD